jgi:hypothetical protein
MNSSKWRSRSSGKEPHVLKVDEPRNLFGAHADLIKGALGRGEQILYLIYSPIWESESAFLDLKHFTGAHWENKREILELSVYPASHTLAVTERRFIISQDRHLEGVPPTVQSIPYDRMVSVRLGSAFLLGWFTVQYEEKQKLSSTALLFTASTGIGHFHRAVREYRKRFKPVDIHQTLPGRLWAEVWPKASSPQMERLQFLLREAEFPIFLIHSSETWNPVKKLWRRASMCIKPKSLFVATNFGFFHAVDEPPQKPGMPSLGVEVFSLPPEAIKSAVLVEEPTDGKTPPFLTLGLGRNSALTHMEISLDLDASRSAADLVRWLASGRSIAPWRRD